MLQQLLLVCASICIRCFLVTMTTTWQKQLEGRKVYLAWLMVSEDSAHGHSGRASQWQRVQGKEELFTSWGTRKQRVKLEGVWNNRLVRTHF